MSVTIRIDIQNNPNILVVIEQYLESVGWKCDSNVITNPNWTRDKYPNHTPKYFQFDLVNKLFSWAITDKACNDEFQVVSTREEAISIAEFAVSSSDLFKPEEPKIIKEPEFKNFKYEGLKLFEENLYFQPTKNLWVDAHYKKFSNDYIKIKEMPLYKNFYYKTESFKDYSDFIKQDDINSAIEKFNSIIKASSTYNSM